MPPPRTSLYREHSSKSQELQRPPEEDSRSTGIIFDGNALQNVTVFVSRKGHLVSFISAPRFLCWFRFPRLPPLRRLRVPCTRFHRGDHRQNDVCDSDHQVPHRSHLLPQGPPRAYI